MIHRYSCSQLEKIRKNPLGYAQMLLNSILNNKKPKLKPSMLAHWQDSAKDVHRFEKNILLAKEDLARKYREKFNQEDRKGMEKQQFLLNSFERYCLEYDKMGFKFFASRNNINWEIHPNGILTGYTPWITEKDGQYYIFQPLLDTAGWQDELKYPLIQQYLAKYKFNCSIDIVNVGVYSIRENQFDFTRFSNEQIKQAIIEVKYLITIVNNQFDKIYN